MSDAVISLAIWSLNHSIQIGLGAPIGTWMFGELTELYLLLALPTAQVKHDPTRKGKISPPP